MFHMLTCFNLRPGEALGAVQQALDVSTAHMQEHDLVVSNSPIGLRQSDTPMDTDGERHHQYFTTTTFRDRAQVDAAYDYIKAHTEPGFTIHNAVYSRVQDAIFICWQDT
jgi:hypothetical protein